MSAGQTGILINRHYIAYSKDFSKWNVLVDGQVIRVLESKLRIVQNVQKCSKV
jgi:hypothetical protein